MDELAGRYLTLCLRLSRLVPGFVAWYAGPERLLAAVHSEPRRLPERLAAEADRLAADVASEATLPTDRADWLTAQLVAVGTIGRARAGEALPFHEHVRHTIGLEPDGFDEERAVTALATLEAAVPGTGPLRSRLVEHRRSGAVPADRVVEVVARAVELLRPVASGAIRLPDDEYLSVRAGPVEAGWLEVRPDGRVASRLAVDPQPVTLSEILAAAAAATYPGEHTVRVLRTSLLVDQFGRGECTLELRAAPARVAATGAALTALGALLPAHEQALLLDQLGDVAGRQIDAHTELAVQAALADLDEVVPAAAGRLHAGEEDGARSLLQRHLVRPGVDVEATLSALADRETAVLAHVGPRGRRAATGFLTKQEDPVAGWRRLVTEQLTPQALVAGR